MRLTEKAVCSTLQTSGLWEWVRRLLVCLWSSLRSVEDDQICNSDVCRMCFWVGLLPLSVRSAWLIGRLKKLFFFLCGSYWGTTGIVCLTYRLKDSGGPSSCGFITLIMRRCLSSFEGGQVISIKKVVLITKAFNFRLYLQGGFPVPFFFFAAEHGWAPGRSGI